MLLISALLLSGCASLDRDCSDPEIFCAGLVTDTGGLHDDGLTQSTWGGIQRAQADGVVEQAAYIESLDARDYIKNIDWFARRNYDVIITGGIGLREDTLQAADRYPDSVFIALDQLPDESRPNLIAVTFPEDQAGFLAGALAAQMTQTGAVGAACETSGIASNWRACEGFRAGARYENPEVNALILYRDNGSQETLFRDAEWGRAAASELMGDGADVIFGVGGGTGQAALIAASGSGAYAIGWEQDQFQVTRDAQEGLLTSLVKNGGPSIYELLQMLRNGRFPGPEYAGTFEMSPSHGRETVISEAIRTELAALQTQLGQKTLLTGVPLEAP